MPGRPESQAELPDCTWKPLGLVILKVCGLELWVSLTSFDKQCQVLTMSTTLTLCVSVFWLLFFFKIEVFQSFHF